MSRISHRRTLLPRSTLDVRLTRDTAAPSASDGTKRDRRHDEGRAAEHAWGEPVQPNAVSKRPVGHRTSMPAGAYGEV